MDDAVRRAGPHRGTNSDDEDRKSMTFYPYSVQSNDGDAPTNKAEQVVGSILPRNSSASRLSTSSFGSSPESGPMKNVAQLKGTPPVSDNSATSPAGESSETTPLLSDRNCDTAKHSSGALGTKDRHVEESDKKGSPNSKSWSRCYIRTGLIMFFLFLLLLAALLSTILVYIFQVDNSDRQNTSVLYNDNDTIIVVEVNSKETDKISFKLVSEGSQPLHVISLYLRPCNGLLTYNSSIIESSAPFPIDNTAQIILFPTYLVNGSHIEVATYILNVSAIDVHITLYFFNDINLIQSFATNLDKSVYHATIYTMGPGVQNTSTFVNYTIPSTGYYFAAIDTDTYIRAQFDITLLEVLYSTEDYQPSCTVESNTDCVLSDFSSQDEQECILAHAAYVRDAEWTPVHMNVTVHPKASATVEYGVIWGALGLATFIVLIVNVIFFGLYSNLRCKHELVKKSSGDDL